MILRILIAFCIIIILMIVVPVKNSDWKTASRESANLVPLAKDDPQAKVQIYSARAFGWRGRFSVHSWIAIKEKDAQSYTVYEATMWSKDNKLGTISVKKDIPDRYWYGHKPEMLFSASGDDAEKMIPQIQEAINSYPHLKKYQAYPGPNSNTFISHIIRNVKPIRITLPANAIGKDYLGKKMFAVSESGKGVQLSIYGMLGLIVDGQEGFEVNILGLSFGVNALKLTLNLPFFGRVGFNQ